jgi:hypothetical protein
MQSEIKSAKRKKGATFGVNRRQFLKIGSASAVLSAITAAEIPKKALADSGA